MIHHLNSLPNPLLWLMRLRSLHQPLLMKLKRPLPLILLYHFFSASEWNWSLMYCSGSPLITLKVHTTLRQKSGWNSMLQSMLTVMGLVIVISVVFFATVWPCQTTSRQVVCNFLLINIHLLHKDLCLFTPLCTHTKTQHIHSSFVSLVFIIPPMTG